MARRTHEEYTLIRWLTACASIAAPTVAEINAGFACDSFTPKDGLKVGTTNNKVKNDDITSAYMPEIPGSYGNDLKLTLFRDDVADTAWTTLGVRNVAGFVVIRRMILRSTAVAVGQKVEVYPATTLFPEIMDTAENERVKFTVGFAVTSVPNLLATVA